MTRVISAPSFLVGIGAGLASALLFASLVGGSMAALPLFLLAPLPLAIAAFGWGTPAGLVAGAVAILAVGFGFGFPSMIAVLLIDVAPMLIAVHLLGLARLTDPDDAEAPREWYPIGRALVAVVIVVCVATLVGGFAIGFDVEETTAQVLATYRHVMSTGGSVPVPASTELEPFVRNTVQLMPAFFPAFGVLVTVLELWVASRIVRKSGRLARPAEDLAAVELPIAAGFVFAATTALAFVGGTLGVIASVIAGALFSAHLLVGMGVLQTVTRGSGMRIIILAFVYGIALLFTLPAALIALAGLAEPFTALRRRRPPGGSV